MKELYPEIPCYKHYTLPINDLHNVYYEESGNPNGIPVIFLHGGPGSGCNENHRRYFNPDKYRIIIFDQRGCNRSSPQGGVIENTTRDLLRDMEQIRTSLNIDKWLVFGGSWGATLSLLYAEAYPERVLGMILRGTFLARQRDLDWFAKDGANRIFPDYWEKFVDIVPLDKRHNLITAYHAVIHNSNDASAKIDFARAWSVWASKVVAYTLLDTEIEAEDKDKLLNQVSIETHYAFNSYFIEEDQILKYISKIPDVPITIIHGRRDLTCTLEASWLLHKALPDARFSIIPDAGHLAGEPAMVDALVSATDNMSLLIE